jgi:DNA-binding transcriptional MerR regulator
MKQQAASLTIGELARRSGVKVSTVRVYERQGLLPAAGRSAANYRLFSDEAVARIRFARRAQQLGFTLAEIGELLALRLSSRTRCGQVWQLIAAKLRDVEGRIRSLRAMRRALQTLAAECERRPNHGPCPLLEHLETDFDP